MGDKLQQEDHFPSLTLNLSNGETLGIPEEIPTR